MDLQAGIIYKTKDYDKFIIDSEYNRDIVSRNVKNIYNSIKTYGDYGHCYPIVVDDKFRIIDGQHRFTARKQANLTIYYIQDIELDSKVLGGINDAISKWKTESYQKVAKDSKIIKFLQNNLDILPNRFGLQTLLKAFNVNKTHLLTESAENIKLPVIERKMPQFIYYSNILENKMSDFNSSTIIPGTLCSTVFKLAKYGVKEEDIPNGNFSDIMSSLYQKQLIK